MTGQQRETRVQPKNRTREDDTSYSSQPSNHQPWRVLDLFRNASSRMLIRTAIVVAVAWVPLAILSAFRGRDVFLSFLTDYATLSRFLIVIPVLILGEQPIHARYAIVAHHFEKDLIADNEQSSFQSKWRSHENLMGSTLVRVILLLLTFALAGWLSDIPKSGRK